MFGDLSFSHILILLLVLVLVFGAKRIPEIGSSIGQGIKEFKRSLRDAGDDQTSASTRTLQPPAASSGSIGTSCESDAAPSGRGSPSGACGDRTTPAA